MGEEVEQFERVIYWCLEIAEFGTVSLAIARHFVQNTALLFRLMISGAFGVRCVSYRIHRRQAWHEGENHLANDIAVRTENKAGRAKDEESLTSQSHH